MKGWEEIVPHFPNSIRPTLTAVIPPLLSALKTLSLIPMAHFNNDTNSHYTTFTTGNFDLYPDMNLGSAIEAANVLTFDPSANHMDMIQQPGPMAGRWVQNPHCKHSDDLLVD